MTITIGYGSRSASRPPSISNGYSRLSLLAERPAGFGQHVTGGLWAPEKIVTNFNDTGPGSLRDACENGPAWVTFTPGMAGTVTLQSPQILLAGDVTIDGRGADISYDNYGFHAQQGNNILAYVKCDYRFLWNDAAPAVGRDVEGPNGFATWPNYYNAGFWLHHVSFLSLDNRDPDDSFSMTRGARFATLSWCKWDNWNKCSLIGTDPAQPTYSGDKVTWAYCWWHQGAQRQPLIRYGKGHVYSSWWDNPGQSDSLGILASARAGAHLLLERSVASGTWVRPLCTNEGSAGAITARECVRLGAITAGANVNAGGIFDPSTYYAYTAAVVTTDSGAALMADLSANAGWLAT